MIVVTLLVAMSIAAGAAPPEALSPEIRAELSPGLVVRAGEELEVNLFIAAVDEPVMCRAHRVRREVERLLDRRHEDLRMTLEVLVQRRRAALGRADDEQVRPPPGACRQPGACGPHRG